MHTFKKLITRMAGRGNPKAVKVVVSGMPKSGTTAILKLLGDATGMKTCNDPFFHLDKRQVTFRQSLFEGDVQLSELVREYPDIFDGAIIKDPNFPLLQHQLRSTFINARVVHLVRNPFDNIRSILDRLGMDGSGDDKQIEQRQLRGTWRNVLEGQYPTIVGENHIERLANRWLVSVNQIPQQGMVVLYEAFRQNKQVYIEDIAIKLHLPVTNNIADKVNVQFQPGGRKKHLSAEEFFTESAYNTIKDITAGARSRFGYE